ncbi:DUF2254 domain-containing protein [Maliponia aquimaris]|uniref:DUF2254 domain-containing protein n=1 Tax=Maliponia aquimaris TaxID=1673631 RepID=A0A238L2X5_9RHOB|nr:DUF2254 domain-containing protein [Maliponia aquimaris]SMX48686.1 hypothetical protein MAA8898_04042 [Maliponia aquimaris]
MTGTFAQAVLTLRRISRILWVRVALISALSVLAALSATPLGPLIPEDLRNRFGAEATLPILTILANGMLAVATFSLGVMVSTHRTLAEQSTPRIHRLLMEDTSTQTMLATFIGAFVFALSSIILYRAGYYSDSASVIVFAITVFVVAAIVVSLVRWIGQLSQIGSLEYALLRAEQTAAEILKQQKTLPRLGGCRLGTLPEGTVPIPAPRSGVLRRVEMDTLQACAETAQARVWLERLPGALVLKGQALAQVAGTEKVAPFAEAFVIGTERTYEQDPAYALRALRESAQKALSPGINDPGTAIDVVARLERLLWDWAANDDAPPDPVHDRVALADTPPSALLRAAFDGIARDGATSGDVLDAVAAALCRLRGVLPDEARAVIGELLDDLAQQGEAGLATAGERRRLADRLAQSGE